MTAKTIVVSQFLALVVNAKCTKLALMDKNFALPAQKHLSRFNRYLNFTISISPATQTSHLV